MLHYIMHIFSIKYDFKKLDFKLSYGQQRGMVTDYLIPGDTPRLQYMIGSVSNLYALDIVSGISTPSNNDTLLT